MKNLSLLLFSFILPLGLTAQEDLTIGKSKKFESRILGGGITYYEHLPCGYETSGKTYPVVVMMNGQSLPQFALDAATLDQLAEERIPDMILIGISNTGAAGKYWSCPDDGGQVKNGEAFSVFLKEELIPEIEKNYRTNGYRILEGQSNSALFVIRQLLTGPDLFNAYIVASPMFGWCSDHFLSKTKSFLQANPGIKTKLYISYGDLDYVQVLKPMNDYRNVLKEAPEGVNWRIDPIENAGHVPQITLNNAMLFFFSECTLNPERRKMDVPQIRQYFARLSNEYGFTVQPKASALLDMAIDLHAEKKSGKAIELINYLIELYPDYEAAQDVLKKITNDKNDE